MEPRLYERMLLVRLTQALIIQAATEPLFLGKFGGIEWQRPGHVGQLATHALYHTDEQVPQRVELAVQRLREGLGQARAGASIPGRGGPRWLLTYDRVLARLIIRIWRGLSTSVVSSDIL